MVRDTGILFRKTLVENPGSGAMGDNWSRLKPLEYWLARWQGNFSKRGGVKTAPAGNLTQTASGGVSGSAGKGSMANG